MHEKSFVGASLLAKAPDQTMHLCLTHRFREQARSHKGDSVCRDRTRFMNDAITLCQLMARACSL